MVKLTFERIDSDFRYGKCYTEISEDVAFSSLIEAIRYAHKNGDLNYEINQWIEKEANDLLESGCEIAHVLACKDAPDGCLCGAECAADCTCFVKDKKGKPQPLGDTGYLDLPCDLAGIMCESAYETARFWVDAQLSGDDEYDDSYYEKVTGISADYEWSMVDEDAYSLPIVIEADGEDTHVETLKIKICDTSMVCLEGLFVEEGSDLLETDCLPLVTPYGLIAGEYNVESLPDWAVDGVAVLGIDYRGNLLLVEGCGDNGFREIAHLDFYKWSSKGFKGVNNSNVDFLVMAASALSTSIGGVVASEDVLKFIVSIFDGLDLMDEEASRRIRNGANCIYRDVKIAAESLKSIWSGGAQYSVNCAQFYLERFFEEGKGFSDCVPVFAYVVDVVVENLNDNDISMEWVVKNVQNLSKAQCRCILSDSVHDYNREMQGRRLHPTAAAILRMHAIARCKDIVLARSVFSEIIEGVMVQSHLIADVEERLLISSDLLDNQGWTVIFSKMRKSQLLDCLASLSLIGKQARVCRVTAGNFLRLLRYCAVSMVYKGMYKDLIAFCELWANVVEDVMRYEKLTLPGWGDRELPLPKIRWMSFEVALIQVCLVVSSSIVGDRESIYGLVNVARRIGSLFTMDLYQPVSCAVVQVLDNKQCAVMLTMMAYGALDLNVYWVLNSLNEKQLDQACIDAIPESCLLPLIRTLKDMGRQKKLKLLDDMKSMLAVRLTKMTEIVLEPNAIASEASQDYKKMVA